MSLKIIQPTPGLTTTERILQLIEENPQGITVKELSDRLNRPVSMINLCLKVLVHNRQIYAQKNRSSQTWIYTILQKP